VTLHLSEGKPYPIRRSAAIRGAEMLGSLMSEIVLKIDGMHCGSCIRRVTQAIHAAGPFAVEEVRLGAARFAAREAAPEAANVAIAALAKAGFAAHLDA
jgi:copper chaperone